MYGMQCRLLYPKYGRNRCHELQCMRGRLWGYHADCKHIWVYGVYGGQLQDQRRQCSVYCVRSGLLYPKYGRDRCNELQCVRGGIRG